MRDDEVLVDCVKVQKLIFEDCRLTRVQAEKRLNVTHAVWHRMSGGKGSTQFSTVPIKETSAQAVMRMAREILGKSSFELPLEAILAEEHANIKKGSIDIIALPTDSRIITGDMIVRGGNHINGTPFAFEAALILRASSTGDLVEFECALYRERNVTKYPPGKSMDDYTPEAWSALPTEPVRDYAWNRTPARLSGAYGIYGGGNSTSPIGVSDPMFIIDGHDIPLRSDFITLTKPYHLEAGQSVMARYGRLCSPATLDEAPADYIYRATIECRLGFLASTAPAVREFNWVLDYSQGGTLSLRR